MTADSKVLSAVRSWPRGSEDDLASLVRDSLALCRDLFRADRVVLAWAQKEEPGLTVATLSPEGIHIEERDDEAPEEQRPEGDVASAVLAAGYFEGMLFVSLPAEVQRSALDVVAAVIGLRMDELVRARELRDEVTSAERAKVARDLHDGLLQSFTGVVLQLETIHSLLVADPLEAARLLTRVQAAIMADQRELRAYVEALRPRRRIEHVFDFVTRLRDLRQRFEDEWGVVIALDSRSVDPHVGGALGMETFRIVQEAVTNSARHGGARRVEVRLHTAEGLLVVDIDDDGAGLPVRGRLTLAEMRERGIGPSSLAERVTALNGELVAHSTESGLHLRITLPLGWAGS